MNRFAIRVRAELVDEAGQAITWEDWDVPLDVETKHDAFGDGKWLDVQNAIESVLNPSTPQVPVETFPVSEVG